MKHYLLFFGFILMIVGLKAQSYVPITVSGFNSDLIANGTGSVTASTTNGFDNDGTSGANFYVSGYLTGNYGLPTSGVITSASTTGVNYQLANYSDNNALLLTPTSTSGTINLENPGVFSKISILAASAGSGSATPFTATLNFSDGTNASYSFSVPDWFQSGTYAITGVDRVYRTGTFQNINTNPKLFDCTITLTTTDAAKILTSITATKTSTTDRTGIFAICGVTAVGAPGKVTALEATSVTTTGFTANWNSLSAATSYYMDVSTSSNFSSFVGGYNNYEIGNVTSQTISGLSPGVTYYYRIRASNSNGQGPSSNVITSTTTQLTQTITFGAITTKTYGNSDFDPGATASSELSVNYSSSNTSVATIVSGKIHIIGSGSSSITATQPGNTSYAAAADVSQTLTVNKANQSISFESLSSKNYGDADFSPEASTNSGLDISYSSANTSVATIVSGKIHIVGVGSSVITASQAGNSNYNAAMDVTQSLTVNKASQTINFNSLPSKTFGDTDFDPGATASSGLAVTYVNSNSSVATIVSGLIHIVGVGSTTITASQEGNESYSSATEVTRELIVSKENQTITFSEIPEKTYGNADFSITVTSSSGLSVILSSSNSSVATISSHTIHIVGAGTAVITASQAGNEFYNEAENKQRTLTIAKADQTITFDTLNPVTYGGENFYLNAASSAGLEISYKSSDENIAVVENSQVEIKNAGKVNIIARQAGNENYNPAPDVTRILEIGKASQTITFPELPSLTYGDEPYELTAFASSNLDIDYTSSDTLVASVKLGKILIKKAGNIIITARQLGDSNYLAAEDVQHSLLIGKAEQTITFDALQSKTILDTDFEPGATATSGLSISYTSSDTKVASIIAGKIHIEGLGTCYISAIQEGNEYYNPARTVINELSIAKATPAVVWDDPTTIEYGTALTNSQLNATSDISGSFSYNPDINTFLKAGNDQELKVVFTPSDENDYNIVSKTVKITVLKKPLTVIADNKYRTINQSNPTFSYSITGYFKDENESELTNLPIGNCTAGVSSVAGDYEITLAGGFASNYSFGYISGILKVTSIAGDKDGDGKINGLEICGDNDCDGIIDHGEVAGDNNGNGAIDNDEIAGDLDGNEKINTGEIAGDINGNGSIDNLEIAGDTNGDGSINDSEVHTLDPDKDYDKIDHIFTPNGDGYNDYWKLPEIESYGKVQVKIYNRWGALVYESSFYQNDWDGTSNGKALPEGAYYFIAHTEKEGLKTGVINLIR